MHIQRSLVDSRQWNVVMVVDLPFKFGRFVNWNYHVARGSEGWWWWQRALMMPLKIRTKLISDSLFRQITTLASYTDVGRWASQLCRRVKARACLGTDVTLEWGKLPCPLPKTVSIVGRGQNVSLLHSGQAAWGAQIVTYSVCTESCYAEPRGLCISEPHASIYGRMLRKCGPISPQESQGSHWAALDFLCSTLIINVIMLSIMNQQIRYQASACRNVQKIVYKFYDNYN